MPDSQSPRPGQRIGREELRRRREKKLAELVASAGRALDDGGAGGKGRRDDKGKGAGGRKDGRSHKDGRSSKGAGGRKDDTGSGDDRFEKAQDLLDEATLLSPDDPRVLALWKRLDAERPARVEALLQEARTLLEARSIEAAAACAERATDLQPDSRAALDLRNAVRARLNAGSRRAQAGWRIAAGVVVGVGSLAAATFSLLPEAGALEESGELVADAGDEVDADGFELNPELGGEPVDPETGAPDPDASAADAPGNDSSALGSLAGLFGIGGGRIDGTSLTDIAGAAFPEEPPAAPAPASLAPAARPPLRAAPAALRGSPAPTAPEPEPSPAAPIVVVRLCDQETACGALRVSVEPAAEILFNGVRVGAGAQGMLRLPAGRHQIRLRSDEHEFRRMIDIARGAPATLEVDLADEGLPLLAPAQ